MSDSRDLPVGPVQPIGGAAPVQPVRAEPPLPGAAPHVAPTGGPQLQHAAAVTDGNLPGAYAQFFINPDTHDVVIRVRDATTDQVINEYPSREIEAMNVYMKKYADTLARRHAARSSGSSR